MCSKQVCFLFCNVCANWDRIHKKRIQHSAGLTRSSNCPKLKLFHVGFCETTVKRWRLASQDSLFIATFLGRARLHVESALWSHVCVVVVIVVGVGPPRAGYPPPHVTDGWGARLLRWLSVLVWRKSFWITQYHKETWALPLILLFSRLCRKLKNKNKTWTASVTETCGVYRSR